MAFKSALVDNVVTQAAWHETVLRLSDRLCISDIPTWGCGALLELLQAPKHVFASQFATVLHGQQC